MLVSLAKKIIEFNQDGGYKGRHTLGVKALQHDAGIIPPCVYRCETPLSLTCLSLQQVA